MFGKVKKTDSKVRFQNKGFRNDLQSARNYKRHKKNLPDTGAGQLLKALGFGSAWSKIALAAALLLASYLLFVPNFLFIKTVEIKGLKAQDREKVAADVQKYLSASFVWPQKNFLLLSKSRLYQHILRQNPEVLAVRTIEKNFPNALYLELEPRLPRFVLEAETGRFIVANDGMALEQLPEGTAGTPENLIRLKAAKMPPPSLGQNLLQPDTFYKIERINRELVPYFSAGRPGLEYGLDNLEYGDLNINTGSFGIIADIRQDQEEIINRFKLLWSQMPEEEKQALHYMDLRLGNKAFVCVKNAACAKEAMRPVTATGTPTTTAPALEPNN